MAIRFTKSALDRILAASEADGDRFHYDSGLPGFAFRVRGRGATFVYEYRRQGRVRRITIGRYGPFTVEQARKEAAALYRSVSTGGDPAEERKADRQRRTTFADTAGLYLADLRDRAAKGAKRGRRSTAAEFSRMLDRLILPKIGRIPIADLDVQDIEGLHRSLASTPAQANRALTLVSAVLGFAVRRKLRPAGFNPCSAVVKFPETGKRDPLSDDELRRLGRALREAEKEGTPTVRAAVLGIRLIALTGMRRTEVFAAPSRARTAEVNGLLWGDIHLGDSHRYIRLRGGKAGAREVPLGKSAVELLQAAQPDENEPERPLCLGRSGSALVGVDRIRRRLFSEAGIKGKDLHSLRHTFASKALNLGVPDLLVKVLLGHAVSTGETARYLHPDRNPLHSWADRVSRAISALLSGGDGDLLRFPARPEARAPRIPARQH